MTDTVRLPGGDWRLWPQFSLRGAGFPAAGVLRLAPAGVGLAADKFGMRPSGIPMSGPEWAEFERFFGEAAVSTAVALQEIASLPAFRAAVGWQNRAILRSGIAPFLAWTPTADSRSSMPRQREELVAHYWQRFCAKNDTIGFFGPVGWGAWDLSQRGVTVESGDTLIATSEVYFSSWAIDTIAKTISADPELRQWLAPRRMSFARIDGGDVLLPGRPAQPMEPAQALVLPLCDGTRAPAMIAAETGLALPEVLDTLAGMAQRRWLVWKLDVPVGAHPDQELRAILERIGDTGVRDRALDTLAVLEAGKARVRAAVGNADALVDALTSVEADFVELTESEAQRAKGAKTSANRALVYSDSRRTASATIGSAILDELAPLAMCLTAARWMTNRFARAARERIGAAFRELAASHSTVDLASLWMHCVPVPHPRSGDDIDRITDELRQRWQRIIGAPDGARRVRLSATDIADAVRAAFDEPGDGWNIARYVSPDVFVVADDAAGVDRGDFELVIGELHVAMNTVGASLFVMQHPDRAELLNETNRDFPGPRMMPMLPKEQPPRWNTRSRPALVRERDYLVGMVDFTADPHRPRTLPAADVVVEDRDGDLVAVLPDGTVFDLLDVFGNALTNRVMDRFTLRADADHSPRVTVDKMVLARESWRRTAADLTFADEKSEAKRFVMARCWRDELEMPRFVFVVSPTEPRPFYVDFDSPVYVNILAKALRRLARKDPAAKVSITEMLPTPEQAWLTDHNGDKYSSELRFVAVDETAVRG